MARIIAATLAGAVVYYVWGMLTWIVIPLHGPTVRPLPSEQSITEVLRSQNVSTGVYSAPFPADPSSMSDPNSAFMKDHAAGPIYSIFLHQEGAAPMAPSVLIGGFVIDLLAAALAVCLLLGIGPCGSNYWCRVGFVAGLGIFVAIVGHVSYWNWMYFAFDYTMAFVIDVTVGWTLAGLAIAALVRPLPQSSMEKKSNTGPVETLPTPKPESQATIAGKQAGPKKSDRNDAITLLATLQREARFIDIVKEPLAEYSDAQVGAAARDVLRDCGVVLDRLFKIQPILSEEDGAAVGIPADSTASKIRLTGNVREDASGGVLVHHGWEAQQCELPTWSGPKEASLVVAQAEVEVK